MHEYLLNHCIAMLWRLHGDFPIWMHGGTGSLECLFGMRSVKNMEAALVVLGSWIIYQMDIMDYRSKNSRISGCGFALFLGMLRKHTIYSTLVKPDTHIVSAETIRLGYIVSLHISFLRCLNHGQKAMVDSDIHFTSCQKLPI